MSEYYESYMYDNLVDYFGGSLVEGPTEKLERTLKYKLGIYHWFAINRWNVNDLTSADNDCTNNQIQVWDH